MAFSTDFHKKKYMTFTRGNVQRAVWDVNDSRWLGLYLGVPQSRQREIRSQFSDDPKQHKKVYIDYFIDHDPLASWRRVIVALDYMDEKGIADKIRHLAEAVAEPSLSINNLQQVTASVWDWKRLGKSLDVPLAVLDEIETSPAYLTEEEKKEAVLLYFLSTIPMASWARLAGALYYMEEKMALYAVRVFLTAPQEPSLTLENLSSVLDIISDDQWDNFGDCVNIPDSERQRILRECSSDRERKQTIAHSLLSNHPAPSWILVARALYLAGWVYDESCHRALEHLQQLFPTAAKTSAQAPSTAPLSDSAVPPVSNAALPTPGAESLAVSYSQSQSPVPPDSTPSGDVLSIRKMLCLSTGKGEIRIIDRSAVKYKGIGAVLLNVDDVSDIEMRAKGDPVEAVTIIYQEWMRKDEHASWEKLTKCFRTVKLNALARDIEQHFKLPSPRGQDSAEMRNTAMSCCCC